MLKAGDLARREDRPVRGVKVGKTGPDRGISHVWAQLFIVEICAVYFRVHTSLSTGEIYC